MSVFKAHGKTHDGHLAEEEFGSIDDNALPQDSRVSALLEIALESPALHIAFPPLSSSNAPEFLEANAIVAVACADSSIHLISFATGSHLSALKETDNRRDGYAVKSTMVDGSASHQDIISSLAVTWTGGQASGDQQHPRSRSSGRTNTTNASQSHHSFLVASTSPTGSGLLVVHRVPFSRHKDMQGPGPEIIARQFMRTSLLKGTLHFNPATHPSPKHAALLITSPASGVVKVLDISQSGSASKRRRSRAEMDADNDELSSIPCANVSLTLYAEYKPSSSPLRRKEIIDATWALNGRVIVALLEDGDWGIWTVEADSTSHDDGQLVRSRFTVCGNVSKPHQKARTTKNESSGLLAPLTPHTRKGRSAELFGTSVPPVDTRRTSNPTGRLNIYMRTDGLAGNDSALLISFSGGNSFLASLRSVLRLAGAGNGTGRVKVVPHIRLGGELPIAISLFRALGSKNDASNGLHSSEQNLIVLTKSRLILHMKLEPEVIARNLPLRSAHVHEPNLVSRLANNDTLDLDAMDRMLERMDSPEGQPDPQNVTVSNTSLIQTHDARVVDLKLASPTISKSTKSKLIITGDAADGRRKLFG